MALRQKFSAALSRDSIADENAVPSPIQSSMLPVMLGDPERLERASVFDASSAINETLMFFSQHRCRLYFADLYHCEVVTNPEKFTNDDTDEAAQVLHVQSLITAFRHALDLPADAQFDICLLWDLPNYLDDIALWAFGKVLAEHTHADTRLHCFGVHNTRVGKIPFASQRFAVTDASTIVVKNAAGDAPQHPHTQKMLQQAWADAYQVERSLLLGDGKLELLLRGR